MKHLGFSLLLLQYYLLPNTAEHAKLPVLNVILNQEQTNSHYDAIIVPGVPYKDKNFALIFKARILWAKHLFESGKTDNIIFSGGAVYNEYIEGKIMKQYADSLHIPAQHTFAETSAEHSTENVYYSMLLAQQLGFKKLAVATDHFQAILIKRFVKKYCPGMDIILIDYNKIDLTLSFWPQINPSAAIAENFVSLPERESKINRWGGTLGKHIVFEKPCLQQFESKNAFPIANVNEKR